MPTSQLHYNCYSLSIEHEFLFYEQQKVEFQSLENYRGFSIGDNTKMSRIFRAGVN